MAKLLKLRRGTTTQHASFTGAEGEVTIDTTKDTAVVHDGSNAGGRPLAREDMSNVSSASIAGRLGTDSIATSKIAGGALPTDVTVASANIVNGTIVNADIAANAAIEGTKLENSGVTAGQYGSSSAIPIVTVDAQGLVTAASTTAIDSTQIANGNSNVAVANNGDITITRGGGTPRLTVDAAGVEIDGTLDITGNVAFSSELNFMGTENNKFLDINLGSNTFNIRGTQGGDGNHVTMMTMQRNGATTVRHAGSTKLATTSSGVNVTGNVVVTGTVDGVDVAALNTTVGNLGISGGAIASSTTATTQAASDNSTKVATTAYVTTGIANAQAFPSGTKMLFQQTAAPTGWTKVTSGVDNKALRVVSGTAGSGGSNAFSNTLASRGITANSGNTTAGGNVSVANQTQGGNVSVANANTGGTVDNHTLTVAQMPSHNHNLDPSNGAWASYGGYGSIARSNQQASSNLRVNVNSTGGGGSHSHGFTGSSHTHNATFTGSAHTHNATFTGSAHNHSISVTNLDMAVQYLDVIIASKD